MFDLSGSNGVQVAERVHDCIGKLLAELIIDAAGCRPDKGKKVVDA